MSIEGSSDTESFGFYMRNILAPALKAGQIVLMDNLSVHKSKWVRELIEERGCQLCLLPSYSPGLNPIEGAFSKVKGLLKEGESQNSQSTLRSHWRGTPSGQQGGCPRLLRGMRLQDVSGPLIMKTALGWHSRMRILGSGSLERIV